MGIDPRNCIRFMMAASFVCAALQATAEEAGGGAIDQEVLSAKLPKAQDNSILKNVIAEFRSDDTANQAYKFNNTKESYLGLEQEVRLGWKFDNGIAVSLIGAEVLTTYGADAAQSQTWTSADPSVNLMHAIYKDETYKVTGEARLYFRAATSTIQSHTDQYQYYLRALAYLGGKYEAFNVFSPHVMVQPGYASTDITSYWEDRTGLVYRLNKSVALGLGQYTQVEEHAGTQAGLNVELYPVVELKLAPTVTLWPTIFVPVAAQATVSGGATSANLDNTRAELYLLMSL